ncbi:RHS repeat-associated core domain-containing protein [Mariprofundus erugo]|uniref:RHS repeat-associated core domain-containing protein n=1 Tax=Mariprofundus erugo TaxID=2528639 RepID=UPI0010FEA333|nr:RHS repeat-associated core domain-containing protein [Mariprofundus erugo]TLS75750.1 RHS repeat-associated core domain-containing protein [Mariprofundus erugo]
MEQVATLKTMKYVHNDQLGSINVITDSTGAVLERLSFDAFGKPRNTDATDTVNTIIAVHTTRGYTGHKMDAEVGLINMNARLYDPTLGRFISADVTIDTPTDMQTFNRYHYVMNNPFRYTDPSGNGWWSKARNKVIGVVGMAVGTAIAAYGAYTGNESLFSLGVSIVGASNQYYHGNNKPDVAPVTIGSVSWGGGSSSGGNGGTQIDFNTIGGSGSYSSSGGWTYNGYSGSSGYYGQVGLATGNMPDGSYVTDNLFVLGDQSIQSTMAPWEIAGGVYGAARVAYGAVRGSSVLARHGRAYQDLSSDALRLRREIRNGSSIYRQGNFGRQYSDASNANYWSPNTPSLTVNYAEKYGTAGSNSADWIMSARMVTDKVVVRKAPGYGSNSGGALEAVTEPNAVRYNWFSMP